VGRKDGSITPIEPEHEMYPVLENYLRQDHRRFGELLTFPLNIGPFASAPGFALFVIPPVGKTPEGWPDLEMANREALECIELNSMALEFVKVGSTFEGPS
jgi:hypothetical protein